MWLCCQQPWGWLRSLKLALASVWLVDEDLKTITQLGQHRALELAEPRWVLVTPWLVLFYFQRVRLGQQHLAPRWWVCCGSWTDATAFARCRRLALFWREHSR